MFRFAVCIVALACVATTVFAVAGTSYAPSSYGVSPPQGAEAQANAETNNAAAIASAAKINAINLNALNQYGYEIGVPVLVQPFGVLTNLYSASLPAGSFVGKIDPVFVKGPYGKIQHVGESSIGVIALTEG